MYDWKKEAEDLLPMMIDLRRQFHAHPELGNHEQETDRRIEHVLEDLDIPHTRICGTGITGTIGAGKPCVLLRADIDALPIKEETQLPYASCHEGIMHACGHDLHMAALLGALAILKKHEDWYTGSVRFVFQPDEEGDGGAQRMVQAGVLDGVSAVFGLHCDPTLPAGTIGYKPGGFYAAAATFDVTVNGQGCHGAQPEKGTDSLYAAARMCCALKEMTQGEGENRQVVTIGSLHGGNVRNVISDSASFSGIIRVCSTAKRKQLMQEAQQKIQNIASALSVQAEIHMHEGYPGVVNSLKETQLVQKTAETLLGKEHCIQEEAVMTTEDFGYYLLERPGSFYHLGTGIGPGLHSPLFCPNENSLVIGAMMHAAIVEAYGKEQKQ